MLSDRFEALLTELLVRWETWWRAPRAPERVIELGRARMQLDDARAAIAGERVRLAQPSPVGGSRTSVGAADRARLAVHGVGFVQG